MKSLRHVRLFVTPWTVAYQAPPSMGFSRQEYWSGLPFPSPGDLPDPGSNPCLLCLLHWQADSLPNVPPESESESEVAQSCLTLTRLLPPWDSPDKNTEVGCHFLLQGFFPTQGLNLGLPHCRQMVYHLSYQRSLLSQSFLFIFLLFF